MTIPEDFHRLGEGVERSVEAVDDRASEAGLTRPIGLVTCRACRRTFPGHDPVWHTHWPCGLRELAKPTRQVWSADHTSMCVETYSPQPARKVLAGWRHIFRGGGCE